MEYKRYKKELFKKDKLLLKEYLNDDRTYRIKAEWGSELQRRTALGALNVMLESWEKFFKLRHSKNKISISVKI